MTNGFTKKSIGTLSLGEKLRKLRSDKRISLNEVSKVTRIQAQYLEYLEEGEYDRLPADVYVKGFLRSYADFLGVDEQIFLRLYEKEKGIKKNLEKKKKIKPEKKKPVNISSFIFTPKKILVLGITILVLSGLFFLYKEIDSFSSAPNLVVLNPPDGSEANGNSVYVEGATDQDAALFINDQPIFVGDQGKFRENLTLQPGLNNINVKSVNKFGKEATRSIAIRSNFTDENSQNQGESQNASGGEVSGGESGGENASQNQEIQIDLRVDPGPVWLSVEADDNLVFSGTMLSGAIQVFKAKDKIIINSGRGNATFVKFNGKEIGTLSAEPNPVRDVVFTKDTQY